MAATIHQNKRAGRAKAAKVEKIEASGTKETTGVCLAECAAKLRKVVERIADVNRRLFKDLLPRQRRNWNLRC